MVSFVCNFRIQIIWILLVNSAFTFAADTCIVRLSGGKMKKYGNCERPEEKTVRQQIKALADREQAIYFPASTLSTKLSEFLQFIFVFGRRIAGLQLAKIGSASDPQASCREIKRRNPAAKNAYYHLITEKGGVFQTYCDMETAGGGWTLVASVHENDYRGQCTKGDRWSSEHGSFLNNSNGDGFWENNATYGNATSAAEDDYKNPGYFTLNASNIMIWHVPNNTTSRRYASSAIFKYHTEDGFLSLYGGNLASLYRVHFPMRSGIYTKNKNNGPAVPIVWDVGSNDEMMALIGPKSRSETTPGFVQFRAINWERNAYALCPGVKIRATAGNVEHVCIGSTNKDGPKSGENCGDFSAMWVSVVTPKNLWGADRKLLESVVMIFYK